MHSDFEERKEQMLELSQDKKSAQVCPVRITFFLNLFVRAHLIPHFLDLILKSRNILALALYDTNI